MKARFLLRFDDLCPTMNWRNWSRIEKMLKQHGIKPIIAVVPDNKDSTLIIDPPRIDFWDRVRAWQAAGWTIGLHGYQHHYETRECGLLDINRQSEFAGLPLETQRQKMRAAIEIFSRQGIHPDLWVAPSHSFDKMTVQALVEHGIDVLSDGFFWRPVRYLNMTWIPQQLWRFRPRLFGLWTVCIHPNTMSEHGLREFEASLEVYSQQITSVSNILRYGPVPQVNAADLISSKLLMLALHFKTTCKKIVSKKNTKVPVKNK